MTLRGNFPNTFTKDTNRRIIDSRYLQMIDHNDSNPDRPYLYSLSTAFERHKSRINAADMLALMGLSTRNKNLP